MKRVFRIIALRIGVPWVGIWSEKNLPEVPSKGRAFLFNWHGSFPAELWENSDTAFFHMIRDPRDILISGMWYHMRAGKKGERFLHLPRAEFEGKSYQEYLCSLSSYEERLLFEMKHRHEDTLREMRAWPATHPRSFEGRYEFFIQRNNMMQFRSVLSHLGLTDEEQEIGLRVFWTHSAFGKLFKTPLASDYQRNHVAVGSEERYLQEMPHSVGEIYSKRYGRDLIALGYAKGDEWVQKLPITIKPREKGMALDGKKK